MKRKKRDQEKQTAYAREWRKNNPEASRAATRRYEEKNPEVRRKRYKRLRKDPDLVEKERARSRAFSPIYRPVKTAKAKVWRDAVRKEVIAAYGGKCVCCGESNWKFLTIDHIFNDGAKERRKLAGNNGKPRGGIWMYACLKKQGFPQGRHQLLCWNCNCGRARNGGICPHKG